MGDHEIRHTLDCDIDTYWRCVFDEEYNRRLYEVLKFRDFKYVAQENRGENKYRKMYLNPPPADLPAPVAKVIGDISWHEEGTWDAKTKRYKFKILPASLPDKTHINGEVWCESRGDKKCERVAKTSIEVKVMIVGGMVEKHIAADMKKSYDVAAKFTNDFVKEKGW